MNSFNQSKSFRWIIEIVGKQNNFSINSLLIILLGFLYTLKIVDSNVLLWLNGCILPSIFLYFNYKLIQNNDPLSEEIGIPSWLRKDKSTNLAILFDAFILMILCLLIQFDVFQSIFWKILSSLIIPSILLIVMKVLFRLFPKK